jgi:chorismate mutase
MNSSGSVLEGQLRQRIVSLEDSLARLASTRKELHNNVDVVKNEVRLSFSHQLSRLRHREQQILEKLDTVASVKDGIL